MTFDEYWSGRHLPTEGQYRPLYDAALRAWNVALEQGFQDGFAEAKETDLVERGFADRLGKLERVREAVSKWRTIPGGTLHESEVMAAMRGIFAAMDALEQPVKP